MTPNGSDNVLAREQAAVARIKVVHHRELERVRAIAKGLADEAAVQTEDGIRDLVDPDAEADAAVEAALVRQTSQRAIAAARRVTELESRGAALAFGHITHRDGERFYIGRFSVIDGDDALLVDWRARASVPFYRATPLEPQGLTHRRHLLPGDGVTTAVDDVAGYSDEVFDLGLLGDEAELRGEAAILASVSAPTPDQMRSVVATIQAEQDAIIRAPADHPLLVQGGPGTGKTVVALHRAAYLLYDQRDELADTGVLIVGPSNAFLRYIADVLPSLGESGVVSVTVPKLYVGLLLGHQEDPKVAELKGRLEMATLLAKAVADRQRRPTEGIRLFYGSRQVELSAKQLQAIFDRAQRHQEHNEGAFEMRHLVLEALLSEVYDPTFIDSKDATDSFRRSARLQRLLLRHFPPLSPEQALNDLWGSPGLLRSAARETNLTPAELELLYRERTPEVELDRRRWSEADVPLLDELLYLLGGVMGQSEDSRVAERDAADEFELARLGDDDVSVSIDPIERPDDPQDSPPDRAYDDPYFDVEGWLIDE